MSFIKNGKFYKGSAPKGVNINSQYKAYRQDQDRLDHAKDIIQPYKGNNPNPEFIREYPDNAKRYFNQQQIEEYGNG